MPTSRRRFLAGVGAAGAALAFGAGNAAAQSPYGDWFDGVSNYEGTVDYTGQKRVTVKVGVDANGGAFGFGPAAIKIDPGTTVVWNWTGDGGSHNVQASDGSFESKLTDQAGFTFEQTFESTGIYTYYCMPHKVMGMKGAVAVGDVVEATATAGGSGGATGGSASDSGSGGATSGGSTAGGSDSDGTTSGGSGAASAAKSPASAASGSNDGPGTGALALVGSMVIAALSPLAFAGFLGSRDSDDLE